MRNALQILTGLLIIFLLTACISLESGESTTKEEELNLDLLRAIKNGNLIDVKVFIEKGGNINQEDKKNSMSLLNWAIWYNRLEIVKYLIENGADVTTKGNDGDGALHYAAVKGSIEILNLLLEKQIDINNINNYGNTPLHYAIAFNNVENAKFLITKGANINIISKKEWIIQPANITVPANVKPLDLALIVDIKDEELLKNLTKTEIIKECDIPSQLSEKLLIDKIIEWYNSKTTTSGKKVMFLTNCGFIMIKDVSNMFLNEIIIKKIGKFKEDLKYWPINIELTGSFTAIDFNLTKSNQNFEFTDDFKLQQDDYDDWELQ